MALEYKDYYQILGVPRAATDEDIRKAFRKLAREYHPDVARDKAKAEEKFKEINEAYEVLSDSGKRKKYDELGADWKSGAEFRPPPGWQSFGGGRRRAGAAGGAGGFEFEGTGFSDFFEQIFGSARGRRGGFSAFEQGGDEMSAESGNDVHADLLVSLEEAHQGGIRSVSLRRTVPCPACGGTGLKGRRPCPECAGQTEIQRTETYQVRIPAGVTDGQLLRLGGKGGAGAHGGKPGDLFLRVRLGRHPDFRVEGAHLYFEVELAPWEAVLGAQLSVPTLDGSVSIRIPAGTQSGQRLRVRGRGLGKEGDRGDLFVEIRVVVPQKVSESERKLWEKLAADSDFDPRA
jgi:DnaJ-class molecular chaperone